MNSHQSPRPSKFALGRLLTYRIALWFVLGATLAASAACSSARGAAASSGAQAVTDGTQETWTPALFQDTSTMLDNGTDWDVDHGKGTCANGATIAGLSEVPGGQGRTALCGAFGGAGTFPGNVTATITAAVSGDQRRASRMGDWATGYSKWECGEGEYIRAVSEDASGQQGDNRFHAIQCASGTGLADTCHTRTFDSANDGWTAPDWDVGAYKGQCSPNEYVAGISLSTQTGAPHSILCCSADGASACPPSPPASSSSLSQLTSSPQVISSSSSGYVVDIQDVQGDRTQFGETMLQSSYSCGSSQTWSFSLQADGSYTITNVGSGLCMDATGNGDSGDPIIQDRCGSSPTQSPKSQHWWVQPSGAQPGAYYILNGLFGLCIDITNPQTNGSDLMMYVCQDSSTQAWKFGSAGGTNIAPPTRYAVNQTCQQQVCIQVYDAAATAANGVKTYDTQCSAQSTNVARTIEVDHAPTGDTISDVADGYGPTPVAADGTFSATMPTVDYRTVSWQGTASTSQLAVSVLEQQYSIDQNKDCRFDPNCTYLATSMRCNLTGTPQ